MKKMGKKKIIIVVLSVVLLFSGCSTSTDIGNTSKGNLMSQIKGASWPKSPNKVDSKFQQSLFDFSWKLFQESSQNEGNVLISPASVYLALGMAYTGADAGTSQAIAEALRATGLSKKNFNTACRNYISILSTLGGRTELSIANSIWYREGFTPDKDFLQKNADFFAATAEALDFDKPEALKAINGWVKKETNNTIDKIIDSIDRDVVMYLINAVYFKSDWQEPFIASNTGESQFQSTKGPVTAKFMNRTGKMDYISKDGVQGVMLPYDDGRFSFFALLPKDGTEVREFISELDDEAISSYLQSITEAPIILSLPKFEVQYEDSLNDEMTHLGMGVAFDRFNADFSQMNAQHLKNLFISEIRHKTFCRVDEMGTEASAVTSIAMTETGGWIEPNTPISFDRPFVYGIVDTVTGAPLFLGLMENPIE